MNSTFSPAPRSGLSGVDPAPADSSGEGHPSHHSSVLPSTVARVEMSTAQKINERIERETVASIARVASGGPGAITQRLAELDEEWDIERTLEANASTVILLSMGMGWLVDRKWLKLPVAVAAFLLVHALQGWCPPLPILRRLGVRTEHEINLERTALRILRGDFQTTLDPRNALAQAKGAMVIGPAQ